MRTLSSSLARALQYCSKACQTAHWSKHKADCRSPYLEPSWTTDWDAKGLEPDFMKGSSSDPIAPGFAHSPHIHYVWGNMPAMDCLNAGNNEGDAVTAMNLNLAFAGKYFLSPKASDTLIRLLTTPQLQAIYAT